MKAPELPMPETTTRPPTSGSRSALIIKFGQIGDVIMAVPAVHQLHQRGYAITWVCGRTVAPLLSCYSWIKVVTVDEKAILFARRLRRVKAVAELWGILLRTRYDLCVTLYYDRRYSFLLLPVRARQKVSLSRRSRDAEMLPSRNPADELTRVLLREEDGCRESSMRPLRPDRLPPAPLRKAASPRIAVFPGGARGLVRERALNPAAEQTLRHWPVAGYVELVRSLVSRGWEVLLMGGPDDSWASDHFSGVPVTDFIGRLSLPEVLSTCDECDAAVSHDTGPLHVAGLSRASVVGLFGPTSPHTFLPRRPGAVGIWGGQDFACRPCYDGRSFAPCRWNGCMHQITVPLVLREIDRLLHERERGNAAPWRVVTPEPASDHS